MRFIETPIFTDAIDQLLSLAEYHSLQVALVLRPRAGAVVPQSGGLRKLRWSASGRGKRGGCRIIYHWEESSETFYMLFAYAKGMQDDLTQQQIRTLRTLVREEFR